MQQVVLVKVDPAGSVNRWYAMSVQATLLDSVAVVCTYGSRERAWQRERILPAGSLEEAVELLEKLAERKVRRGYEIVSRE